MTIEEMLSRINVGENNACDICEIIPAGETRFNGMEFWKAIAAQKMKGTLYCLDSRGRIYIAKDFEEYMKYLKRSREGKCPNFPIEFG